MIKFLDGMEMNLKMKRNRVSLRMNSLTHKTIKDLDYQGCTAQRDALNEWARKGFKGSIIAATGFGKSRVGSRYWS